MKKHFLLLLVVACTAIAVKAQPQLSLSISTGDDDLREGSKVNISVIYYNPARTVLLREVAGGRRFADRTTFNTAITLPAGVPANSIQEIQLEYIPDPSHNFTQEADKWWFTRFLAVYQNAGTNTTLFENNSVARKFESRGNWSTGVLPGFSVPAASRKIVVNNADNGAPAPGAQVYLKLTPSSAWTSLGITNSAGEIVFTQNITASSQLMARHRIHEQNYYRSHHNWNSSQNWNYRVYLTNLNVQNDGTIQPEASGLTSNRIVVPVRKRNTLIGCNLLASAEWDLSTADVNELRNKLRIASDFLYNATDGQFFFEQVTIYDRAFRWDDSDFRIYNSTTLRANVPYPPGAFLGQDVFGSCMKMARTDGAFVYAHEFGHYGLAVRDEYSDDDLNVACSPSVLNAGSSFFMGTPAASCMMFDQQLAGKLCSNHAMNPHIGGTRQGDQSCWDKIKSRYNNSGNWSILSPTDKGAIVPTLMVAGGAAFTTLPIISTAFNEQSQDAGGAGVIRTHTIRTETATGAVPVSEVEISTITPAFSFLGITGNDGVLAATGLRSTVEVLAMHASGVGAVATVNPVTTAQTIIPLDVIIDAGSSSTRVAGQPNSNIRKASADAEVQIAVDATGKLRLLVKPSRKLINPPLVSYVAEGVRPAGTLKAASNSADMFIYELPLSKAYDDGVLIIKGEYEDKTLLRQTIQLATVQHCPEEIFAFNGLIAINKSGRFVTKGRVLLYSVRSHTDKLPKGAKLIGLPFVLKTTNADFNSGKPTMEVRLPRAAKGGVASQINTAGLKVYKFDDAKKAWYPQQGFRLNTRVGIFAGDVNGDGLYVVVSEK